ncbi:EspA/EspE family type VII secretion system effector [Mycobacterium sp. NPDC006124]|uniref:EspA/EspE family type VII secretion system effector n=1 Tax=Mycobacterium sp. NPDC006124 TaxID=3156729 RepID=UPI00339E759A
MSILEKLFNLGNGIRSGVEDVPALLGDLATGDLHGVLTDGRKVLGDANDVIEGAGALGVEIGRVPAKYLGSFGKLADSPILSAAQLAIEGEKKLTGSGDPHGGSGYTASATTLEEAVETLIRAEVKTDAWDGAAATTYDERSKAHRKMVSDMSVADAEVGRVLDTEAQQVVRARNTLDTASQGLYDYGLATSWMLLVPGLNTAKLAADSAAVAAAMGTTNMTMMVLAHNALENSRKIKTASETYAEALEDNSGEERFAKPENDQKDNLPTRLRPGAKYTPVKPMTPQPTGPPATPYDAPAPPHP